MGEPVVVRDDVVVDVAGLVSDRRTVHLVHALGTDLRVAGHADALGYRRYRRQRTGVREVQLGEPGLVTAPEAVPLAPPRGTLVGQRPALYLAGAVLPQVCFEPLVHLPADTLAPVLGVHAHHRARDALGR